MARPAHHPRPSTRVGDRTLNRVEAWSSVSVTSPPTTASGRAAGPPRRGARPGVAVLRRAHPHPGRAARRPTRAAATLPRKYWHCYDLFVALTAAAAATSRLRVGSGICLVIERDPIITAKEVASVDHLSGGPLRVRRRRGLEPRGDGQPRHRPARADGHHARAGRGDEGDLDPRRGQLPRRARRTSSGSGPSPSPRSARTRRSSSAATARRSSTACWPSATPGCPTSDRAGLLDRVAELRGARRSRRSTSRSWACPPTRASWSGSREAGVTRACTGCRPAAAAQSSATLERWEAAIARVQRRGVTADEARRRFVTARVARLATAGRDGAPHLVPIVVRARGRHPLQRGRPQAQAHDGAAAAGQRRRQPARRAAGRPLRRMTGSGCGGCAPTGPHGRSRPGRSRRWRGGAVGAGRPLPPYRTRPPTGTLLVVEVHRWTGWSAR